MSIHKYKDWSGWWGGLRSKALQAGAESLVTNLTAMIGSNGVAAMIPSLHDFALTWRTALFTTGFQFAVRTILAAAQYVKDKPDADVITETVETTFIKKAPDETISQGSKVTTVTPVDKPKE